MFNPVEICSPNDKVGDVYKLKLIINFDNFQIFRPQIHENNGATKTNVSTRSKDCAILHTHLL